MFVFFKLFPVLSFESLILSWCYGKRSNLTYFVLLRKFSNDVERRAKVPHFFSSSVNYRRIYSTHLKNLRFAEDVWFYPTNEVTAFPKIKIKWVESAMFMFTLSLTR